MPDDEIEAEKKFTIEKELEIVERFLTDTKRDIDKLVLLFRDMKEGMGRSQKEVLNEWDKVLKDYMFFQEDVDVNGERVKKITKALLERAKASGVEEEVIKEFSEKDTWKFDW